MKITSVEYEPVHVLDSGKNIQSVIQDIANTKEESFFVLDIDDLVQKHKTWQQLLPRITPHYAVKCNDSLAVLEILAALGTGFDCASKGEIDKILALGVEPNRIIFANPARPISHIQHAADVGVYTLTFDSEAELHKVKKLFPDAKMVIRIKCDAKAVWQLGLKFGCDAETEAPSLLQLARELGLDVVGVSFHVGSGCTDPPAYRRAIADSRKVFDCATALGYNFHLLDIGGGYPGEHGTTLNEMASIINLALDDFFPDPSIQIISEPGRYYVASAYTLACNIHSVRRTRTTNTVTGQPDIHYMYYMNDGVYSSFNCVLFDHRHIVGYPLKNYVNSKAHLSTLWGPTCDSLDLVAENTLLPELEIGDWLTFEDMGAYTIPAASTFNGFPVAKVHNVVSSNTWSLLKNILPVKKESNSDEDWSLSSSPTTLPLSSCKEENVMLQKHVLEYINESCSVLNN